MLTKKKAQALGWEFFHEDAGGAIDEDQARVEGAARLALRSVPSYSAARFNGSHRFELLDESKKGLLLKIEAWQAAQRD